MIKLSKSRLGYVFAVSCLILTIGQAGTASTPLPGDEPYALGEATTGELIVLEDLYLDSQVVLLLFWQHTSEVRLRVLLERLLLARPDLPADIAVQRPEDEVLQTAEILHRIFEPFGLTIVGICVVCTLETAESEINRLGLTFPVIPDIKMEITREIDRRFPLLRRQLVWEVLLLDSNGELLHQVYRTEDLVIALSDVLMSME